MPVQYMYYLGRWNGTLLLTCRPIKKMMNVGEYSNYALNGLLLSVSMERRC